MPNRRPRSWGCLTMSALALQRSWGFIVPAVCSARLPTTWSSVSTPQAQSHVCGKRKSQQFDDLSAVSTRQLRTNLFLSAKYANLTRALETYEEMKSRRHRLGREEVNTLLYVCQSCPDGGVDLTLRIYDELKDGLIADENTDVILVRCYADLGRVEDGLALIAERRASGQPPRLRNYSPILQRLWKDGDDVRAKHVWKEMLEADVMPNEEVIVGMLECYAARGREAFLGNAEDVEELLNILGRTVVNVTGPGLDAVEGSFNSTAPWAVRRVRISAEAEGAEGDQGTKAREHTEVTSSATGAGICPSCGGRLQRLSLTDEERKHFREGLLKLAGIKAATWAVYIKARVARQGVDAQVQLSSSHTNNGSGGEKGPEASPDATSSNGTAQLQAMEAWLAAQPPFDFVIDAPNVAYYGQNFEQGRFSFRQVDMILSELRAQGKRAFITIPMKYTNRRIPNTVRHSSLPKTRPGVHRELEDSETDLLKRWMEEKIVFRVPRGQLDDLYWMYATVADSNSKLLTAISNDCMRDHWEDLLDQRTFMHWRTSQVMSYSFLHDNRSATSVMLKAAPFSREAQRTPETGCLHLPSDRSDDDWLCVDLQRFHNPPPCADALKSDSHRHEQGSKERRERVRERRPTSGMGFGNGLRGRRKGSREEKGLQEKWSTTASRDEKKTPLTAHGLRPWERLQ